MSADDDIKQMLHSELDPIEVSAEIPQHVVHRGRKRRRMTSAGVALVSVVIVGLATLTAVQLPDASRVQPADRGTSFTVPFEKLPVRAASRTHGLIGSPVAPPGFPDCTLDMLDIKGENGDGFVSLNISPLEGVQCGLGWWPDGSWTDSAGEVYEPPRSDMSAYAPRGDEGRNLTERGRLLLMGSGGARTGGTVADRVCSLEPPITYSITVAGEPIDIGTLDDPTCQGRSSGDAHELPYFYDLPALETPMGSLDPRIEDVKLRTKELSFTLALTNDTDESIGVGRCPFYDLTFVTAEGKRRFRSYLNCPAAPDEVRPGDVLRFQIYLPLQGPTGSGTLKVTLSDENRPLYELETKVPAE